MAHSAEDLQELDSVIAACGQDTHRALELAFALGNYGIGTAISAPVHTPTDQRSSFADGHLSSWRVVNLDTEGGTEPTVKIANTARTVIWCALGDANVPQQRRINRIGLAPGPHRRGTHGYVWRGDGYELLGQRDVVAAVRRRCEANPDEIIGWADIVRPHNKKDLVPVPDEPHHFYVPYALDTLRSLPITAGALSLLGFSAITLFD